MNKIKPAINIRAGIPACKNAPSDTKIIAPIRFQLFWSFTKSITLSFNVFSMTSSVVKMADGLLLVG